MSSTTTQTTTTNGTAHNVKSVLTISLARHLHGYDIEESIEKDWSAKATPAQQRRFDNQGFNLDPTYVDAALTALTDRLHSQHWDGVIVGWCTRGNKKFTVLFEKIVNVLVRENVRREGNGEGELKLLFSDGPDDLFNTTLRGFEDE